MDHIIKYITAHLFIDKRTERRCIDFLFQIKKTRYKQILEIYKRERYKPKKKRKLIRFVCDGFGDYKSA